MNFTLTIWQKLNCEVVLCVCVCVCVCARVRARARACLWSIIVTFSLKCLSENGLPEC